MSISPTAATRHRLWHSRWHLCAGLRQTGTRVRLVAATVAPVAVEVIAVAALVLLHHLPALLVAAGIKDTIHD